MKENQILYVYTTKTFKEKNYYKIGETGKEADVRIKEQDGTSNPEPLEKVYELNLSDRSDITAYELEQKLHKYYYNKGKNTRDDKKKTEWFEIEGGVDEIKGLIESMLSDPELHKSDIVLKPHQKEAYDKYRNSIMDFLFNHKARSGKTYLTAHIIKEEKYNNVVILTSYPILNYQWEDTFLENKGFYEYDIIIGSDLDTIEPNPNRKSIILLSLQDVKGGDEIFGKDKFNSIRNIEFDLLVIDEVHYGVETNKTQDFLNKIKYKRMLGLSATPTKNLLCGRFEKENIHTYTLQDESKLKKQYPSLYPYADINFLLWNLSSDEKKELKFFSEEDQFKFDKFFRISDNGIFYYESDIQFLFKKLIGDRSICSKDKLGTSYPFKNNGTYSGTKSILLFVPSIDVQNKLKSLLEEIDSYDDFKIHITNSEVNSSKKLIKKIKRDFRDNSKRNLIIAVDQLTTGITLDDCDIVALMNDWRSVDVYIQACFRCQSPRDGKTNCWVLDFNPARSFELIWEYQNIISQNSDKKLNDNIREWVECVNIFNRVDGRLEKIDFDGFNREYNKIISEKPRFNYQSVILQDKLSNDEIGEALLKIGVRGGSSSSDVKLNEDGIDSGQSKKGKKIEKDNNKIIGKEEISKEKLIEIAKALVDKTMLLSIFNYFKYDNVDECFDSLEKNKDNTDMYLSTLLLGMNDVDKVDLNIIKFIYDNIFDKDIINKKIYIFNQNVNLIYNSIKENPVGISYMLNNLIELIDSYLKPSNTEKKMLGEVFTSLELVEDMLNKLPIEVWSNPKLKFLDPANGIGNFPVILVKKLMEGLKEWQPDPKLRLKHILENQIYICELQSKNMFIYLQLFDPENRYNLNFHKGSFLDENFSEIMKKWGVDKFDIVVGNPPYNNDQKTDGKRGGGYILWDKFVIKTLNSILKENGYLVFVHPTIWRKPQSDKSTSKEVSELMMKKQIHYLECHDSNDGMKVFNAGTRYDFYVLENCKIYKETLINGEDRKDVLVNLKNYNFIPNYNLELFDRIISKDDEEKCPIIFNVSSYETRKSWVSDEKTAEYRYTLVHSTPKKGTRYMYSSINDKGHFGIPKVIFGESGIGDVIIDMKGEYGMTQGAMAIKVSTLEEANNIKGVLLSTEFDNFLNTVMWSNFRIDWRLFSYLKRDFWKEFI